MIKLPVIPHGEDVFVHKLPNCPNCMILMDKLNLAGVCYRQMTMGELDSRVELAANNCFAMEAPVLQVGDKCYMFSELERRARDLA